MILNLCTGLDKKALPPAFSCSGTEGLDWLYAEEQQADGALHWELAILKSCTVNFSRVVPVDLFLVGGGKPGSTGSYVGGYTSDAYGGDGGAGGSCVTQSNVTLAEGTDYSLVIGGSDENTTGFGYTATSGGGSSGGSGAHASTNGGTGSTGGVDGSTAFGAEDSLLYSGRKYGAGGGGAAVENSGYVSGWGVHKGGATGGGVGGKHPRESLNGADGAENTGSGGGGACRNGAFGSIGSPGAGGSGIIIIRNAR